MIDVAAAVDALRTVVTGAVPADVEVYDGPADGSRASAPRAITIAAAFEDDQSAVSIERQFSGARPRAIDTIDVACSIYAGEGDADPAAVAELRDAATALLFSIDSALRSNRTLNGTVGQARISTAQLVQGRDDAGVGVYIGFVASLLVVS